MVEIFTFIISLVILIVFLVMASNIGTVVKILRRIEMNSMSIKSSLEKLTDKEAQKSPDKMTVEEKARAFDKSLK
jgi:predicted Holliday junction resolvase-like endonuclease